MSGALFWAALAIVLVLQQLTQTVSQRAKASGSWRYVAVTAVFSHGVWFASNLAMLTKVFDAMKHGNLLSLAPLALFYITFCTIGNVVGTLVGLRYERGSMRVGATL